MPLTTHQRSHSPVHLHSVGFDTVKNPSSPLLSPSILSTSTISSMSTSTASSISSTPRTTLSSSFPFTNSELWTLYDFEAHARLCSVCRSTYHFPNIHPLDPDQRCYTGRDLAQKVTNVVYSKASASVLGEDGVARIKLPEGYMIVKSLISGIEADLRTRRVQPGAAQRRASPAAVHGDSAQVRRDEYQARRTPAASTYNGVAVSVVELDERRDSAISLGPATNDEDIPPRFAHVRQSSFEQPRPPTRGKPQAEIETPAETLKRSPRSKSRRDSAYAVAESPVARSSSGEGRSSPVLRAAIPGGSPRSKKSSNVEGRTSSSAFTTRLSGESKRTTSAASEKSSKSSKPKASSTTASRPTSRKSNDTGRETTRKEQALDERKVRSISLPGQKRKALWMWFLT